MLDKGTKTNIYAEELLKSTSELDILMEHGQVLSKLSKEIILFSKDESTLELCKHLSRIKSKKDKQYETPTNSVMLKLIQFHGYNTIMRVLKDTNSESVDQNDTLESCLEELTRLVGLEKVKNAVTDLICYQQIQRKRSLAGLSIPKRTLHLAFTGNPGTGKTTVARIVGRIYKHLGLLSKGHFIEASRTDLIAGYQGQTAQKVKALVERAKGGVLFIDEAYSITENEHSDSYGRECLTELTKALEDYRQDLVVIVAGYTDPMKSFFNSNPGLSSRFNTFIEFEDYNETELLSIFKQMCEVDDYELTQEAISFLSIQIREVVEDKHEQFANGRFVRNLYEDTVMRHARRVAKIESPTTKDLKQIQEIDFIHKIKTT